MVMPQYRLKAIKLEVTHWCGLSCIHCSSNAHSIDAPVMSFQMAETILGQAIALGVEEVSFSGGEPLTWGGIADAVRLCTSARIRSELYSSGNIDDPREILARLAAAGISIVIFSVYAGDSATHDSITATPGSFEQTMAAVDIATDLGISVEFHFVPFAMNYRQLEDIVALAKVKRVSQVSVLRFVPQGRGANRDSFVLNSAQNLELRRLITKARGEMAVRTGSPYNFLMVNASPKCKAGIDRLTILPDTSIYPCDAFKQVKATEIVGTSQFSRLDTWSLADCWTKSPYLRIVREYLRSPFKRPCSHCPHLRNCLSGCLAQKYIRSGTLEKGPDPLCLRGAVELSTADQTPS